MIIDIDDPKLTAYALGELDADDAARFDAALARNENAAARALVDDIRATAALLRTELAAELAAAPAAGLTDAQRERVAAGPQGPLNHPGIFTMRRIWIGTGLAAAACVTLALLVPFSGSARRSNELSDMFAVAEEAAPALPKEAGGKADLDDVLINEYLSAGSENASALVSGIELQESADASTAPGERTIVLQEAAGAPALDASEVDTDRIKDTSRSGAARMAPPRPSVQPRPAPPRRPARTGPAAGGGRGGGGGRAGGMTAGGKPLEAPSFGDERKSAPAAPGVAPMTGGADPPVPDELFRRAGRLESERGRDRGDDDGLDVRFDAGAGREQYARIVDNPFIVSTEMPVSTFSIDVDTASYSNVRRFITGGRLPRPDAVRIEELINYFDYDYAPPAPGDATPFATHVEVGPAPWNPAHRLVKVGLKGREVDPDMRPATNLVFLLDVSGSMRDPRKLPLVKDSLRLLVDRLNGDDRIALVVYAGAAGLVLPSTYVSEREVILGAIDRLAAGGSTNGGQGIELAYAEASRTFIEGGVNRVLLCTDGDFNVGVSDDSALIRLIEAKRESDVFLSVFGFGTGNLQDAKMEQLANHGNGMFAYIDRLAEARKVFVENLAGTLVTIAKDVKIQVDFNPARVGSYRLIGYENRVLANRDFADDRKDAGEIGAGHTVTALYETTPRGEAPAPGEAVGSDFMKADLVPSDLMLKVRLRYKQPDGDESTELVYEVTDDGAGLDDVSPDFRFAAAVAAYGMLLRDSAYKGAMTLEDVSELAHSGLRRADGLAMTGQYLEDFAHYARIAQPGLAAANAEAAMKSQITDAEFAALVAQQADGVEAFERALARARTMEAPLDEVSGRLADRLIRGRAELAEKKAGVPVAREERPRHREAFLELVLQTRALAEANGAAAREAERK